MSYGVKDGLNDGHITSICQDSRGYYWISSPGGINRFDGKFFKSFYPSELAGDVELADPAFVFFENKPNKMIVAVANGQLFELDCVYPQLKPIPAFKNKVAVDVFRLNENTIAVGCVDTVFLVNNDLRILRELHMPSKPNGLVVKLRPLGKGKFILATWANQYIWDATNGKMTELMYEMWPGQSRSGFDLLYVDTQFKHLYVSNFFSGLHKLDYTGKEIYNWNALQVTGSSSKMLCHSQNDSLMWVCGDYGVALLNKFTNNIKLYPITGANGSSADAYLASNIYSDKLGRFWICTLKGLLGKNTFSSLEISDLKIGENEGLIDIIKAKDGKMYVAKYYGGIFQIDPKTSKSQAFKVTEMHDSWFIFEDGDYLVQGGKGVDLMRYDKRTGNITRQSALSACFPKAELITFGYKDSYGDYWYSANLGGGLARIHQGEIFHYSKSKGDFVHSYLTNCEEAPNGDMWFSCNKLPSLLHWIRKENRFEEVNFDRFFDEYRIYRSIIHYFTIDRNGIIWLGFDGSGLVRYEPQAQSILVFNKKNGLPSNFIYSIVLDGKNRVWAGTKNGLVCLDQYKNRVLAFNTANGFPSDEFDNSCIYYDAEDNLVWIASKDKLLRFNPDKMLFAERGKPRVFVDDIVVNNQSLDIRDDAALHLNSSENNLHINFSSLNPDNTHEIVYNYSLGDKQSSWIDIGTSRQVSFPNLAYGEYEFKLRAKNLGSEEWVYLPNSVKFSIATPWFRSYWFFFLVCILTLVLTIFIIRTYYSNKVQKQRNIIERQRAIQAERDRISFDMHDDLGSGLTKISYLSQMAMNKSGQSQELNKIKHTSLELVSNMSELIWAMKAENDSLPDMLSYLKGYAYDYLGENNIELRFEMPDNVEPQIVLGEKRRHLFLVYKEALHNIVKHAKAKNVSIRLVMDTQLHIYITDDGVGFDSSASNQKRGNGLKNMEKRAQKIGADITMTSTIGKGTSMHFSCPIKELR